MTEIEPVAVWDARERAWLHRREARSQWLREQGLPINEMFRVEFLLIDAPCARIFCFARGADGRRYLKGHSQGPHDHDACEVAAEPPRIVPLSDLPPRELLGAH